MRGLRPRFFFRAATRDLSSRRRRLLRRERRSRRADELLEGRLFADRLEVGVLLSVGTELLREVDRAAEMPQGVVLAAGEALAASQVVHRVGILGRPGR